MTHSSIIQEVINGRKTGKILAIFNSSSIAQKIKAELNRKTMDEIDRYIEIFDENERIMQPYLHVKKTILLPNVITEFNKDRALLMRGLPYLATKTQVVNFFKDFGIVKESEIHFEQFSGKQTGKAIVFLESFLTVQKAKNALHGAEFKDSDKWIELFDKNHFLLQRIINQGLRQRGSMENQEVPEEIKKGYRSYDPLV